MTGGLLPSSCGNGTVRGQGYFAFHVSGSSMFSHHHGAMWLLDILF